MIRRNAKRLLRERGLDFERAADALAGLTIDIPDLRRDYGERRIYSAWEAPSRPIPICSLHVLRHEGVFIGLQTDYELMEHKRAIDDKLKAIRPRAT
jgi:uncharacterized DUF497 family protein